MGRVGGGLAGAAEDFPAAFTAGAVAFAAAADEDQLVFVAVSRCGAAVGGCADPDVASASAAGPVGGALKAPTCFAEELFGEFATRGSCAIFAVVASGASIFAAIAAEVAGRAGVGVAVGADAVLCTPFDSAFAAVASFGAAVLATFTAVKAGRAWIDASVGADLSAGAAADLASFTAAAFAAAILAPFETVVAWRTRVGAAFDTDLAVGAASNAAIATMAAFGTFAFFASAAPMTRRAGVCFAIDTDLAKGTAPRHHTTTSERLTYVSRSFAAHRESVCAAPQPYDT